MKHMVLILTLLLTAAFILTGCIDHRNNQTNNPPDEIDVDGGVKDNTNLDAPKTITSTQIVTFECEFSTLDLPKEDTILKNAVYLLEARLENGAVKGRYQYTTLDGESQEHAFRKGHQFMTALQKIISEYDLAQYNGRSVHVSGLPDQYGASLAVKYASKETIDASDNQDNFLSIAVMEELEALFRVENKLNNAQESSPTLLDLTVSEEFESEVINGHFVSIRYPVLTLGYALWDGTYRGAEGYEALSDALDLYNTEIRMDIESQRNYTLRTEAQLADENTPMDLYAAADVYLSRNDNAVVSFWENVTWSTGQTAELTFRRTYNFNAKTGEKLGYTDVFTDLSTLPALLEKEFAEKYPELQSVSGVEAVIADSIEKENGLVCFALSNGGVQFFAEKNPLDGKTQGILHITLLYEDYPYLVRPQYRDTPADFIMELSYGTDTVLPNGTTLCMTWNIPNEESMEIEWNISIDGSLYSETFEGYAPTCHVVYTQNIGYLYLQVPTGDVSKHTNVYKIKENEPVLLSQRNTAMYEEINYHPDRILMVTDDIICAGNIILQPYGLYRIAENGMPRLIEPNTFGLQGSTLRLTGEAEAVLADLMDVSREEGTITLKEGTLLTPYRTDKASYIDFMDETGKICRFAIDKFTDDMILGSNNTLEQLLEPTHGIS